MEEYNNNREVQANLTSQFFSSSLKSVLSGRSTPQSSPSFRRLHSSLTPRREGKGGGGVQWFRSNRLLLWLFLITLWAYLGFFVQSRWAHGDKEEEFSSFGSRPLDTNSDSQQIQHQDLIANERIIISVDNGIAGNKVGIGEAMHASLAKKENVVPSHPKTSSKKRSRRHGKRKRKSKGLSSGIEEQVPEIPKTNSTFGFLVGPFGSIEDKILQWSPEKHFGSCNRKGDFARLVRSRRFVLIFHELSMTGAPLSMMELATELLSCGATVSAVVLSKKGGLMQELAKRRIKVVEDKADISFKTAMKADLVIAGSAVCASWIGMNRLVKFPCAILWFLMLESGCNHW